MDDILEFSVEFPGPSEEQLKSLTESLYESKQDLPSNLDSLSLDQEELIFYDQSGRRAFVPSSLKQKCHQTLKGSVWFEREHVERVRADLEVRYKELRALDEENS